MSTIRLGLFRCIYSFMIGALIFYYYRYFGKLRELVKKSTALANCLELSIVLIIIVFVSNSFDPKITYLAPLIFGSAVLLFSFEAGCVSYLLKNKSFVMLGVLSYSIYLVHWNIIFMIRDISRYIQSATGISLIKGKQYAQFDFVYFGDNLLYGDLAYVVYIFIVIAISKYTNRYIEKPFR